MWQLWRGQEEILRALEQDTSDPPWPCPRGPVVDNPTLLLGTARPCLL